MLVLLPTYLTLNAIAESLGRSRSTVKTHVAHIYKKLGARTRAEAVTRARELGLLPDDFGLFVEDGDRDGQVPVRAGTH